jgi:hypothetical protein
MINRRYPIHHPKNSVVLSKLTLQFASSERLEVRAPNDDVKWKVGDVYGDLDRLERAIDFSNAEQNLKQAERMEMLQHFADARRPLFPAVSKFVLAPLALALVMRLSSQNSATRLFARTITRCLDCHFWIFVVAAPILLLATKIISKPPPEPMPEELRGLAPEYLPYVTVDWENPEVSCRDYVMFLLEFWTSAVASMAMVGALQLLVKLPSHNGVKLWLTSTQFLTRIAALASLYHYPKQIFQLQRSQQPRPVGLFPTLMQTLVSCMFVGAPVGIASDLSKILGFLQRDSLIALYSSIAAFLFGTWMRLQHTEPLSFRKLKRRSFGGRLLYAAATTAFWKKPLANLGQSLKRRPFQNILHQCKRAPVRVLLASCSVFSFGMVPILM